MGGSVIVAKGEILSMNTRAFDHVVEKIRPHFQLINNKALDLAYEPMDQGAMTFISLDEANGEDFRDFCKAFSLAKLECEKSPTGYDVWWDRLGALLEKDPRFHA